jgi:hypothetical protein
MSRGSIFDPDGWATEHSGERYMGSRADAHSHMPPDVVDGKVSEEEAADLEQLAQANEEVERENQPEENEDPDKTNPDTRP